MIDKNKIKLIVQRASKWVGGCLSVLGLINVLDDLNSWKQFGVYLVEKASVIGLDHVLSYILLFVHTISTYWHLWLHPVFDFFTSWLPFEVPFLVKDIVIIGLFVLLGKRRAFRVFTKSLRKEKQVISKIVHKYLKDSNERFLSFSMSDAKSYILMKNADKGILESYEIKMVEKFDRCFGESAEEFSYDVLTSPELLQLREEHMSALKLSDRLEILVYCLALTVLGFLFFDYIYLLKLSLQ
ncbi:hypothetical protein [Vibrio parahaemolyticus]|uniref:hypothetical protein n=1 Tax=Vibrio parahaemolyticus TaxID=670 RepID=UPI0009B6224D|nr:hypothetical protein [Vibrio parahaemolyticus]OQK26466.1 putative membrane protein [Vibrio parahaemolyticus]TON24202.1 hypothetical protein CGH60_20880 [Vibrio parahaemolyticus]